jgi:hypothetical protein
LTSDEVPAYDEDDWPPCDPMLQEVNVTRRGKRGSGNGPRPQARYIAKYDYPAIDVKAGQEFATIEDVPSNIVVEPVMPEP